DRLTCQGTFTGIAANDSHQNVSVELSALPDGTVRALDGAGKELWKTDGAAATALRKAFGPYETAPAESTTLTKVQFDPYEISMRHVGTFLQIAEITEKSIRHALRSGRAIVAFGIVAPLPSVGFWVERDGAPVGTVGDPIRWTPELNLHCLLPLDADIRVVR